MADQSVDLQAFRAAAGVLRKLWSLRCDGDLDFDTGVWLDEEMETAGLARRREAGLDDADNDRGIEVGDMLMELTEAGRAALGELDHA